MGFLEGLTSAVGETLSELAGVRSTRTTAGIVSPAAVVQRGTGDATSADAGATVTFTAPVPNTGGIATGMRFRLTTDAGTLITSGVGTAQATSPTRLILTAGTFAAAVLPGRRFTVQSGIYAGKTAYINKRVSDTELELAEPGLPGAFIGADWEVVFDLTQREAVITALALSGSDITGMTFDRLLGRDFTTESWEVVQPAETTINVETTLDWDASGLVYVGASAVRYSSKTSTSLDNVRAKYQHGRQGYLRLPAGVAIVDEETFEIDDGDGVVRTFQFRKPGTAGDIRFIHIDVTDALTAAQVATATAAAIQDYANFGVQAFVDVTVETDVVELWNTVPGGSGHIDTYTTATAVGFEIDGPRGVEEEIVPLQDVADGNASFSGMDTVRASFLVERATGTDLDLIGIALGVPRPVDLAGNDTVYRRLIAAAAYGPAGTIHGLELILDAVLGTGNWEIFEDLTLGSLHNGCVTFFWRRNEWPFETKGKTFLDGVAVVPRGGSSTTLAIDEVPITISNVRLADDPSCRRIDGAVGSELDVGEDIFGRLVLRGVNSASSSDGGVNVTAAELTTDALAGDLFVLESGPHAGKMGIVETPGAGTVKLFDDGSLALEGVPYYAIGTDFANASWRVVRPSTNCRYYKPSEDTAVEYAGGALAAAWTFVGAGAADEGTDVTVTAAGNAYTRIVNGGVGDTILYEHAARIRPESVAVLEVLGKFEGTITTNNNDCLQGIIAIRDGQKDLAIGVYDDAGDITVGFIDTGTGLHIGASFYVQTDFATYTIKKNGEEAVELWVDGKLVASEDYASFANTTDTTLVFGVALAASANAELWVRNVIWAIETPTNYWNTTDTGSTAAANPTRLTSGGSIFAAGDVGKPVRITAVTAVNAGNGDATADVWEVSTYNAASNVELVGPRRTGATFQEAYDDRVFLPPESLKFPACLGHNLVIATGPNAGTYAIDDVIDPDDDSVYSDKYASALAERLSTGDPSVGPSERVHIVQVSPALPDVSFDGEADWYLEPVLPTDAGVVFELVNTSTNAGVNLTLDAALPASIGAGDLLEVHYSRVESAVVADDLPLTIQSYVDGTFPDDVRATITDDVVQLPAGTLTSTSIHARHVFWLLDATSHLPIAKIRIASVDTANDQLILEDARLGSWTDAKWAVVSGAENVEFSNGRLLVMPFYLSDNFGFLRDILDARLAAGVKGDFATVWRATDADGVDGIRLLE